MHGVLLASKRKFTIRIDKYSILFIYIFDTNVYILYIYRKYFYKSFKIQMQFFYINFYTEIFYIYIYIYFFFFNGLFATKIEKN